MSTSLLYHGFGIRGYDYVRSEYVDGGVVFTVNRKDRGLCCSSCGSSAVLGRGEAKREFRMLPIGGKRVTLVARIPRLQCRQCKSVRQAKIGFAERRRT